MTGADRADPLAGARAYEALHVPALFQDWVDPVLDAAAVGAGEAVVDVACGTGVLARGALGRVGPSGSVIGIDFDAAMLGAARETEPSIDWREGDAASLPVHDEAADAVVSQFGMMFFPDRVAAAREMLRVLRPGGRAAVAVFDGLENQTAFAAEVDLIERMGASEAAAELRRPFGLGDTDALRGIFEGAGFADVVVATRTGTARYPDIRTLVDADLTGWLPLVGIQLEPDRVEAILAEAEAELGRFVSDGEAVFDVPAHIVRGRKG